MKLIEEQLTEMKESMERQLEAAEAGEAVQPEVVESIFYRLIAAMEVALSCIASYDAMLGKNKTAVVLSRLKGEK